MRTTFLLFFSSILNFATAFEVLTISDSIVDYILYVNDDFVRSLPGNKGGSAHIDNNLFQTIIRDSKTSPTLRPGASAVNMLKGLNKLGHNCGLITTIGNDQEGDFFLNSLKEQGITLLLQTSNIPTGKSACLVTPNGERTMRTFLGASTENDRLQLKREMFQGISHFHVEGYQLYYQDLMRQSLKLAKEQNASISLDLSSFEAVRANKKIIWELLENGMVDLIFANSEEAYALTDLKAKEAAELLASYCGVAVVTLGEKGCYISDGTTQWQCPAMKVNVVDTIGAGDLFISGFLHGFLMGKPIPVCAKFGTILASQVVQVIGAEIPSNDWESIYEKISQL
ncbi:MAG: adenosine kinase [Candidatus Melainabacteria bacterium]|nr:adenosine kinase [Candidatus Melainabacteria bacterium]